MLDSMEKTVDNLIKYCSNNVICDNCVFYFSDTLKEENEHCGLKYPNTWKGINRDKKDYLLKVNENVKLKEDLQKTKDELQYYKEIYFGGNVDGKE